jgi:hypothetical protein
MWARKTKASCNGEETNLDCIQIEDSWYDVLKEGYFACLLSLWTLMVLFFVTPVFAFVALYKQLKYSDAKVPDNEVRERAHLG